MSLFRMQNVLILGALAICTLLTPRSAQAISLSDLFAGGSITVGDKLFDEWELFDIGGSLQNDLSQVEVTGLNSDPLNPGLRYTANGQFEATAPPGTTFDTGLYGLAFGYRVTVLNSALGINGIALDLTQFTVGQTGFVSIGEGIFNHNLDFVDGDSVFVDTLFNQSVTSLAFSIAPAREIFVETAISLVADNEGVVVGIESFEQHFAQAAMPEPMSAGLSTIGVAALVMNLRRRRSA